MTKSQLQEWANAHQPVESLIYKDGYWNQIIFVRDKIALICAGTYEEYQTIQANMKVISAHTSKSVRLPVFQAELPDGTVFVMRNNFHDWKVSVKSPRDVKADFLGLFNLSRHINDVYCEGFPKELVYGSYIENKRQFTIELPSNHHLFMFFWIFVHQKVVRQPEQGETL